MVINMKDGKILLIMSLTLLTILSGYLVYDNFLKDKDELKCPKPEEKKCVECDDKIKTEIGNTISVNYTKSSAQFIYINKLENGNNEHVTIKKFEIPVENEKIKGVKIINGQITEKITEAAFIIFEDGKVKYAYTSNQLSKESAGEVNIENFEPLEGIEISKINNIKYKKENGEGKTICDIVLKDGTKKTIKA